jgi:ABC transporter substrate binding protein
LWTWQLEGTRAVSRSFETFFILYLAGALFNTLLLADITFLVGTIFSSTASSAASREAPSGVDLRACFRRAAYYVHKILNGVAPGDLPIEFPTNLELVINLQTPKTLGLEIPTPVLARADEVIE